MDGKGSDLREDVSQHSNLDLHVIIVDYTSEPELTLQIENWQEDDLELRSFDSLFQQEEKLYQTKFVDTLVKDTTRVLEFQNSQKILPHLVQKASLMQMSHKPLFPLPWLWK